MRPVKSALKTVFSDLVFLLLSISLSLNLLLIYYLLFLQTTTVEVFLTSNTAFYNWTSVTLTLINALLFGIALTMVVYILKRKLAGKVAGAGNSLFGAAFGAISTGCPVCGAWLLPMLGIAGSLSAFPLQGLEIKLLSIFLLVFSIFESAKSIVGGCRTTDGKLLVWNRWRLILNLNRNTIRQLKPAAIIAVSLLLIYTLPGLPRKYKISFAKPSASLTTTSGNQANAGKVNAQRLIDQVNPPGGYTVKARYRDLGPKLLASGVIDLEKFKAVYNRSGSPLTNEQLKILTQGSDQKITISKDSSYFLINFLWALGLANQNPILEEGPMAKYGQGRVGSFASTGGWTIGAKDVMELYSQFQLVTLTPEQQARVEEAANGTYRPCCGNATAFPDCNHGMAMLGLFELMASQGATTDELFEAAKYFNAFWFPQQYLDLATYFKAKDGLDFSKVEARVLVGRKFSSGQGWSQAKKWLASNNLVKKAPRGGGGCGV